MTDPLHEYDEAVLRMINEPNRGTDRTGKFLAISDLEKEFGKDSSRLKQSIHTLVKKRYIRDMEGVLSAIDGASVDYEAYQLTALGSNYLAKNNSLGTSFSNISNSNIAHNSSNVIQSINISGQPQDIQEKYYELNEAIKKSDASAIKRAFDYIVDKSIDVAIAIATGTLLR